MNATPEEKKFWQRTMGERKQDDTDLKRAQEIIKSHDAINKSLALARDYGGKAREALAEAPDHKLRALLDELIPYTINRES
jgi:octaprenyl-diphosphate synthase